MIHEEWLCGDCKVDTQLEYYAVNDPLWEKYGNKSGMLCVGCLETRMNRRLEPNDFTHYPINSLAGWKKTPRLIRRLKGEPD